MAMGKPVIVSDCAPLKRIIEETGAGFVFQSGDPASFADAILTLKDIAVREKMGDRGYHAVKSKYNWNVDGEHLVKLYSELPRKK